MASHSDRSSAPKNNCKQQVPRSAYIHVPFCSRRCGYCNFSLIANRDDLIDHYLRAIEIELTKLGYPREVDTLFFGGGTPTHLPADAMRKLFEIVLRWFPLATDSEFSIEANPTNLPGDYTPLLSEAGVTRVSIGAQSFDSQKLQLLERDHTASDILKAAKFVRRSNMNLSIDLIFGVPGEQIKTWNHDLTSVLTLEPDHVSIYGLTFEKGTTFYSRQLRGELCPITEETELEMYISAIETLTGAGHEHYEVSNFARKGHRCRHNERYWTHKSYYAAGPGASRFVDGVRETNHRSTTTYIKRILRGNSPVASREQLSPAASAREQIVFGLRRLEGISLSAFHCKTGFDIPQLLGPALWKHLDADLLSMDGGNLRLTSKGLLVSDSIWPDFLTD